MSTWMVVEDEPGIYEVLLAMFEMWGVGGVAFVDGEEAVAWIEDVDKGRAKGERPELAIIDLRLPGPVQGEMVAARLRKSPALKDITIVLITAYMLTQQEEKTMMATAQADRLVYKPLPRFNELKLLLEHVLTERRARLSAVAGVSSAATTTNGVKPPVTDKPTLSDKTSLDTKPLDKKVPPKDDLSKPLSPKEGNR